MAPPEYPSATAPRDQFELTHGDERAENQRAVRSVSSDGVQYNGDGTATVVPTTSEANFITYRLGVVIPIR